jgi:DNA-binding response OmpR family regulator
MQEDEENYPLLTPDFGVVEKSPARILIVDDMASNREVLHDLIVTLGYQPVLAGNGEEALAVLEQQPVDLLLLDILMPKMDGYETLNRLKHHSEWRYIPVIVISAVDEVDSVVRCLKLGADDYLGKPFNSVLLKARIDASLEKKSLRDQEEQHRRQIETYSLQLEGLVYEKTHQLAEAYEQLKRLDHAKGEFLRILAHELRTPLNGVIGAADMLIQRCPGEEEVAQIFQSSLNRFVEFVNQAQLLTRLEVSEDIAPGKSRMWYALQNALKFSGELAEQRKVSFTLSGERQDSLVNGEEGLLTQAFVALLKTAVKFSKPGQCVEYTCQGGELSGNVEIRAHGWSIPDKFLDNFFDLFSVTDSIVPGGDIGLGPPLAARILELYGGQVTVDNLKPPGIIFRVSLQTTGT